MARPPKDARLRKDVDLRIPLTADQKRLIVQAANLAQSDVATWLRPIILQAASDWLAKVGENSIKGSGNE
jgi:uncharacterized protein (DUF1778 family)